MDESEDHLRNTPSAGGPDRPPRYEIRLQGRLEPRWAAWFDGLTLTDDGDGTSALRGPVVDQTALHGVLQRVRDLGLPLLSVTRLGDGPALDRTHPTHPTRRTAT